MTTVSEKNVDRNTGCNPLNCIKDRVTRHMGVARRDLDVAVAERLAGHWQGLAERQRTGREVAPKMVIS